MGNELLRWSWRARRASPSCTWPSPRRGGIGALIAAELEPVSGRRVAVVLTRVAVAEDDPAFADPTKPVGPFYDSERAHALEQERGWAVREDANRGWRRVVPSPRPLEVLELGPIKTLLESGTLVVAVGGGGIPVVARDGRHDGVDAVIDKDHASALLAIELGAQRFVILTQVPTVYTGFGTDEQQAVEELLSGRDEGLIDSLPAGSMRPKVEAAFRFVRETGGEILRRFALEGAHRRAEYYRDGIAPALGPVDATRHCGAW